MHVERLVEMINDIAANQAADPEHAGAAVADHVRRFWDPRMREQILAHLAAGGAGLEPIAREALERLLARASHA